jgi:uncharacterized protein (DUF302 family)
MTTASRHSYSETIARLQQAITGAGNRVFAVIDQAEAAASAGSSLRPTTLVLFGNPRAGTPLMEAFPLIALELPLKLLVWEADGAVNVAYVPASEIAARYGVTGMEARIAAMDDALATLAKSVAR